MKIDAVIFDLHHTLTETRESEISIIRRAAKMEGINLQKFSDEQLSETLRLADRWIVNYQIQEEVDIHFGGNPRDWLEADRQFFRKLGITELTNDQIIRFETTFKEETRVKDFEFFTNDALETLKKVHSSGRLQGICTNRHDNPNDFLERNGVHSFFKTVQWSGVPGFAKPFPFTLIKAAMELEVNPRKCLYLGNQVSSDIVAARRADMQPVLVTWANPEEANKASGDVIVICHPSEILKILE